MHPPPLARSRLIFSTALPRTKDHVSAQRKRSRWCVLFPSRRAKMAASNSRRHNRRLEVHMADFSEEEVRFKTSRRPVSVPDEKGRGGVVRKSRRPTAAGMPPTTKHPARNAGPATPPSTEELCPRLEGTSPNGASPLTAIERCRLEQRARCRLFAEQFDCWHLRRAVFDPPSATRQLFQLHRPRRPATK
jgi:hypothetical protein